MSRIYVGNIPWSITNEDLKVAFGEFGEVTDAFIVLDRETKRSKGFAFVTLSTDEQSNNAIAALDGTDFFGRNIRVSQAREHQPTSGPRQPFSQQQRPQRREFNSNYSGQGYRERE